MRDWEQSRFGDGRDYTYVLERWILSFLVKYETLLLALKFLLKTTKYVG